MARTIAGRFIDELSGWEDSVDFYFEEIGELEKELYEVINRNTIPQLAENAEIFFNRFLLQKENFLLLNSQFLGMRAKLSKDQFPLSNDLITQQLISDQTLLRERMLSAEKKYIELKFDCQKFLSGTLSGQ